MSIELPLWIVVSQWMLLFALGLLVIVMYRQLGTLMKFQDQGDERYGLPIGTRAPAFEYTMADDAQARPMRFEPGGTWSLLLFADPGCASCETAAAQTLIWGSTLGPGPITRNPYAGMWLLLFLVALDQHILTAVLVGAAHGLARAIGTLSNLKSQATTCSAIAAMGEQIRWRYRDGLALLLIAGILSAYLMWMVSP